MQQREVKRNERSYDAIINILDRAIGKPNQPIGDENSGIHIMIESNDGDDYSK